MAERAVEYAEVLSAFLKLGLTSFGGPIAHLGYFRDEFVHRRKWLDDSSFADLVAVSQLLPGPASTKVAISLGIGRAGLGGALAAWFGFALPSAVALVALAYGVKLFRVSMDAGWLHGLKIVAVAVVAQAVWSMARTLCPDRMRATLAIIAALIVLAQPGAGGQILAIVLGGLCGWLWLSDPAERTKHLPMRFSLGRGAALAAWVLFFGFLLLLPVAGELTSSHTLALFDRFFRSGALVFGGGHVVLPLLQAAVVLPGWVSDDAFLAGYGAAQAIPGPLFTFAAYLGALMEPPPNGWVGALLCLAAIFLPGFLLVIGSLPLWASLRDNRTVRAALTGINASVVGLLLAALYSPVWTSAMHSTRDFGLGLAAFAALMYWRVPPWLVVLFTAAGAVLLDLLV